MIIFAWWETQHIVFGISMPRFKVTCHKLESGQLHNTSGNHNFLGMLRIEDS